MSEGTESDKHTSPLEQLPSDVPVFNCHVLVSRSGAGGQVSVRAANLADCTAIAANEREALQALVRKFKMLMSAYTASGEPIPWLDPPDSPRPGEQQRFIPVHL